MATAEVQRHSPSRERHVLLENVSWEFYERFLEELDRSGQRVRLTFDRGFLEIMSPASFEHESPKKRIDRMIETLTEELRIPIRSAGSLLVKLQKLQKGLEPDEGYYVQNEPIMRRKKKFEPERDPPPDLVVEVEISRPLLKRMNIYAAFKAPEIWRYRHGRVTFHVLQEDGSYAESQHSRCFPFLSADDLNRQLALAEEMDETSWVVSFRQWVREHLSERRRERE